MNGSRWLPGLVTLREYQAEWLRHDIVAGVVLATMLVPVGIAYAVASGVPGIYGLYATIVPLLVYALFGPSRILVLGPDSSLAPLILAVVLPLSAGDPVRAIAIASMMAIVSGIVCIGAGLARLGFITELLSKPIRYGYMNGIALTVLISQLPKIFGFSIEGHGPLRNLWAIAQAILNGKANWVAFAVGAGTLAAILALKNIPRIPGILIAVLGATAIVGMLGLAESANLSVLGPLPQGLPWISYADIGQIVIGGSPSRSCRSPTRTSSAASTPLERARMSIPTKKWWGSEPPIWPRDFFRVFPSAAVPRARPWRKPRAHGRS